LHFSSNSQQLGAHLAWHPCMRLSSIPTRRILSLHCRYFCLGSSPSVRTARRLQYYRQESFSLFCQILALNPLSYTLLSLLEPKLDQFVLIQPKYVHFFGAGP